MIRQQDISWALGEYQGLVDQGLAEIRDQQIIARIWAHDHTVWKPESTEITNRLGWLQSPEAMIDSFQRLRPFADAVRKEGYTDALLLGMGGSSLAPEVFRQAFGVEKGYLDLAVLDSTVPGAVLARAHQLNPEKTLVIVSTKSGTTVETLSLFKFFYTWMAAAVGKEEAGKHFIAITDPGSPLLDVSTHYRFRLGFINAAYMGGRYAALSSVGLVPAALIGMDLGQLLERARAMARRCKPASSTKETIDPGALLGAIMAALAQAGRDKITFIISSQIASFGNWLEQLIAESTGKEGKGILPVVGEDLGAPGEYGEDRLFVHLCLEGDTAADAAVTALEAAGHPIVRISLHDAYDLGGQLFLWEMAVAVAGHRLGINPFDQPDVEAAKVFARQTVDEYKKKRSLPVEAPTLVKDGIEVYGETAAAQPAKALMAFLAQAGPGGGGYVALQAFLEPTPEIDGALQALRMGLGSRLQLATTRGYGPRFLHSTGQLHKGDAGKGLFIQFTADDARDAPIPDEAGSAASAITFGILKAAQALGDRRALVAAGRRVLRFHLGKDAVKGLRALSEAVLRSGD
jgi:transaldolase/glucose-6-phosphate isomerase